MRLIDYLLLALRNITRQKLRSSLTIFAVVIGAMSVTIMLALVTGAKSFFLEQVEGSGMLQQIAVSSKQDITDFNDAGHGGNNCDSCVKLTDDLVTKIGKIDHVSGTSRILGTYQLQAITYGDKKLTLNQTKAYDANGVITSNILAGRDLTPADKEGVIVITSDYADKFGFKGKYQDLIGKEVGLLTQTGYSGVGATVPKPDFNQQKPDSGPPQIAPTTLKATVIGISDTANESQMVRMPLDWARAINVNRNWQVTANDQKANEAACRQTRADCRNLEQHMTLITNDYFSESGYQSVMVKADKSQNAKQAAAEIRKLGVGAADAESMINQQLTIFNVMGLILGGIGGIALVVAAIGVINTMVMAILERTREIGVMRAVGARRSAVRILFTFEAAMLGFIGGVVGVGFGYILTRVANVFINKQLIEQGVKASNIIGMPLWLILAVIGIGTLIGMLAGLYPAARAAKLDPVEALRYE